MIVCQACFLAWPRDGRTLFISFGANSVIGKTWIVDLPAGRSFPDLPPGGIRSAADVEKLPVRRVVDRSIGYVGLTAATYAYDKRFVQRNLYRLWLR